MSVKLSKKYYTSTLLTLARLFCNDELSVDEFKQSLHLLCENYRKDYHGPT